MALEQRARMLEVSLGRQMSWIAGIDSRIGFVFAVDMAMLGVLAALAPPIAANWGSAEVVWSTVAFGLLLVSLGLTIASSFPRLDGPTKHSLIYFGCIARSDLQPFKQRVLSTGFGDYLDDLATQCHRNAEIAHARYGLLRWSMVATMLAILPWLLAVYMLYQGAT